MELIDRLRRRNPEPEGELTEHQIRALAALPPSGRTHYFRVQGSEGVIDYLRTLERRGLVNVILRGDWCSAMRTPKGEKALGAAASAARRA